MQNERMNIAFYAGDLSQNVGFSLCPYRACPASNTTEGGVCVPIWGLYTEQAATLGPWRVRGEKSHAWCLWLLRASEWVKKALCFLTGQISFWSIGFAPLTLSFEEHFQKVWNECRLCGKYLSSALTQLESAQSPTVNWTCPLWKLAL